MLENLYNIIYNTRGYPVEKLENENAKEIIANKESFLQSLNNEHKQKFKDLISSIKSYHDLCWSKECEFYLAFGIYIGQEINSSLKEIENSIFYSKH